MSDYNKKKNKGYSLPIFVSSLVAGVLCVFMFIRSSDSTRLASVCQSSTTQTNQYNEAASDSESNGEVIPHLEIPRLTFDCSQQVIEHAGYTVNYNLSRHIPNWVAYELTDHEVSGAEERTNKFLPDPMVEGDPVVTKDYSNSGYDRGHMAPAGDMKWSEQAMRESFYMTNMCPQNHSNNAGDWKDLEELARDLAHCYKSLYICCGPIVTDESNTIGTVRKIVVPQAFYKVFLRQKPDGSWTSIGFVMPNAAGNRPLLTYMLSVDEVEQLTGIDFFYNLPDSVEDIIEADYNVSDWTVK